MKVLKRLPNGSQERLTNSMASTLREADPGELRYCQHCEGWVGERPAPLHSHYCEIGGDAPLLKGRLYLCKRCGRVVAFIADPIPTREEIREKIGMLRTVLKPDPMTDELLEEIEKFTWFGI